LVQDPAESGQDPRLRELPERIAIAAPPDLVTTPGGKPLTAITLEAVLSGEIRISPRTLEPQAQVAEAAGRAPLARALRRAAELTALPDDEIMATNEALRPRCETREGLLALADRLEHTYGALLNATLVREAAVYERRGLSKE
jgi:propanediol dehydratase small subunit